MIKVEIVKYDEEFLSLSWIWLSDPEVKELTATPIFTKVNQLEWFNSLKEKEKHYKVWGVKYDNKAIGVCGLKGITERECEYWGYIGDKNFWGKGLGMGMLELMEIEAMRLKLEVIWLKVLCFNKRAINLYLKAKFEMYDEQDGFVFMRKNLNEVLSRK